MLAKSEVRTLTLEQAIETALRGNSEIRSFQREVEASEARLGRTKSYFLPKIGAETRFEQFETSRQKLNGGSSNLFAEYNLFNGFRDLNLRTSKALELDRSKIDLERHKLLVGSEVQAKFFRLLALNDSISSIEEALKRNQVQKQSAKKRKGVGLASEADILEFDLYETDLQAEIARLKSDLKSAQADFRRVLGQENTEPEYQPAGKLLHFHIAESLSTVKSRIAAENQSIRSARIAVDQSESYKKTVLGGYLPKIDVKATYGSRGIDETPTSPETTVIAVARWELFSGFDTSEGHGEASALTAKANAELKQAELSALSQVESAYTKLKALEERVDLEAENKTRARRFFDVVASEYKRGVKNSADMRSAAQLLLQVLLRDIQYRAEFFEQKALLERAVGGSIKITKGSESGHTD
ncbi:MAG: TolC family protein [Oligoflexia bacterium]|nr:TolC family protein [Oligoflexia bacterium]